MDESTIKQSLSLLEKYEHLKRLRSIFVTKKPFYRSINKLDAYHKTLSRLDNEIAQAAKKCESSR